MSETTVAPAPLTPRPIPDTVPMARYWRTLGIAPARTVEQLDTEYYLILEDLSPNPTEDEEARRRELRHAHDVLRRWLQTQGAPSARRSWEGLTPRQWWTAGAVLVVSLLLLGWMNLGALRLRWVTHEPGTVLSLAGQTRPYGTVVRFERLHAFPAGVPGPAYEVRLAETGETVWIGERLAERGMVRVR